MKLMKKNRSKWIALSVLGTMLMAQTVWAKDYEGHWAATAIDKWSGYGIVKGMENGDFKPNAPVTRAELATFLNRTFQYTPGESIRKYEDVEAGKWYTEAIGAVANRGLMYTPGAKFEPSKPATREEVAYAIAKAYDMQATGEATVTFTDAKEIAIWAQDAVQALVQKGYIKGNPDGSFKPQANITRAEVVTILENLTPHMIKEAGTYTDHLEGNVVIQAADVILKDVVINGNVYLSESIGEGKVRFDNVTVNGSIYVQGGKVTLGGTYDTVHLASVAPFDFTKGSMKKLVVTAPNEHVRLREKTVTDYLLIAADAKFTIEGVVKETSNAKADPVVIEEAGVFIGGNFVPVEVVGREVVINLKDLAGQVSGLDAMESLMISTNVEGAYIEGLFGGTMKTNVPYTFRMADAALGIFEEMLSQVTANNSELKDIAEAVGVSSDTVYAMLADDGVISIRHMRSQFANVNSMVRQYTGGSLPTEYSFKRQLRFGQEAPITITIRLEVE
ncbi:MAG: S-layer homology domain-containing protein [Niameybacter sp.]